MSSRSLNRASRVKDLRYPVCLQHGLMDWLLLMRLSFHLASPEG